jgi:broad specificity phosphatase PhoE
VIVLARHGITEYNTQGRFLSRTDLPLSDEGRRQCAVLAERLHEYRFTHRFSSPMRRCIETCEIVAPNLSIEIDARLREIDFGEWEGHSLEWIEENDGRGLAKRRADPVHFRPPGGESFEDVALRLQPFSERLASLRGDGDLLVVGHRGTLGVLERLLRSLPLESRDVTPLEPAQFHSLR